MDKKLLEKPENYYNREMSWLQFNYRILNEAKDKSIPLFERLNFLSITESNLSEFFMVRVASLIDLVHAEVKKKDIAGLTPQGQLDQIIPETKNMIASQYSTLNRQILPAMEENGLKLVKHYEDLNEKQSRFVDKYFEKEIYPVLTPMAVDSSRPFPLISNKTLNIGALIRDKKKDVIDIATVQVPSVLPRVVEIPGEGGCREIILLEQIIEKNLNQLFLNYEIICAHPYRIMRNADLAIDEDDASDLLKEIEKQQITLTNSANQSLAAMQQQIWSQSVEIQELQSVLKEAGIIVEPTEPETDTRNSGESNDVIDNESEEINSQPDETSATNSNESSSEINSESATGSATEEGASE